MVNMSAKFDKETCNGVVSIMFTRSMHGQMDGTTEPQQRYYIPTATRCAGIMKYVILRSIQMLWNVWVFLWVIIKLNVIENIAMRDYQESVTIGQTHAQTDAGQSDPYVPLCFAGDTITNINNRDCYVYACIRHSGHFFVRIYRNFNFFSYHAVRIVNNVTLTLTFCPKFSGAFV